MTDLSRPTWVEIDLDAIAHNVQLTRRLIGPGVKLFACVKADAYGCGLVPIAKCVAEAKVDALAVADPHDVVTLKDAGMTLPVLLFSSTLPDQAAAVAALGAIVSIHDFPSLEAFAAVSQTVEAYLKIDCGAGRYGFIENQWHEAFARARRTPNLRVRGVYAHPINPENPDSAQRQAAIIEKAFGLATAQGLKDFDRLAASSRFILGYPGMRYTAVDPGRLLLGHLPGEWPEKVATRPAVRAIKSRITQIQSYPADSLGGAAGIRGAVAPAGFADGFPALKPHDVLVCGRRVPMLGGVRGIESMLIDVSAVPDAQVGSEVVLLGRQGAGEITTAELAESFGCSLFDLMYRLTRNTHKRYIHAGVAA